MGLRLCTALVAFCVAEEEELPKEPRILLSRPRKPAGGHVVGELCRVLATEAVVILSKTPQKFNINTIPKIAILERQLPFPDLRVPQQRDLHGSLHCETFRPQILPLPPAAGLSPT